LALTGIAALGVFFPGSMQASPVGADAVTDLYAPSLTGSGGFTTSRGGAPASALNPAAGGDAQRIVFDIGYLGLPGLGDESGYGNAFNLGALFPTKYGVFGGSLKLLQSPFDSFPLGTSFGANLNAAKELYPGMNVGAGLNFGVGDGSEWTLSGDLGFRYNSGKLGPLDNFTWAIVLRSLGKSWAPPSFTPVGGVSFDFLRLPGAGGNADAFKLGLAADLGFPISEFPNMTAKIGLNAIIAGLVTLSASSAFNIKESSDGNGPSPIPSIGLGVNFTLKSGGRRIVAGTLPSDGELAIALAAKPLYEDVWAMGGGLTWTVGVADTTPPLITIEYPETRWISPNNDGKADDLEFPITITDERYIAEWVWTIEDDSGAVIRTYRNKERRPETQGVQNIINRLLDVKSGVEVPPTLRWDGVLEAGTVAPDGNYFFTLRASDDNGNTAVSDRYQVVVDNTPPEVNIEALAEALKIFSPDGDGNKDTLAINQSGSQEDLWEAGIYDAAGTKVKTFNISAGSPENFVWNGTDDEGRIVADGVFGYRITATDKAQNTGSGGLDNIVISTIQPQVNLLISGAYFSPNGDGIKDTVTLSPVVPVKEGIIGWTALIRDSAGTTRRTITGSAGAPDPIDFDGKNDQGQLLSEGVYQGSLSINYRNGYISTAVSPSFTLDITPPWASARNEYQAFSPNNDGIQDEMILIQEGSNELSWTGEIRGSAAQVGTPVRVFRFTGTPATRVLWDGLGSSGALASDGDYTYELYSTDQAGNTGRSNRVRFSLSTADTPVLLTTDLRAFSPNNDGVKDTITITPQLQVSAGIASWKVEIQNTDGGSGTPVRVFEGQSSVPASIPWNGRTTAGTPAPDGTYIARIDVRYVQGNQPSALSRTFALDTVAPKAELSAAFTLFSPNGDGNRDSLAINVVTEGSDEWNAVINDAKGAVIRSWNWTGQAPLLSWDGTDEAGNNALDGTYGFALSSTDEAGNSTRMGISNIVLDARIPRAFLTASAAAIAPKANQSAEALRFGIILSLPEGIESWKLELRDDGGAVLRSFPAAGTSGAPPASISWNGLDERGAVREGRYTPQLSVNYTKGDRISVSTTPVIVDVSGPVLSFSSQPEYFSPDNDGIDDELFISLTARDASPIASWSFEIREPQAPYPLFYRIEGRGSPSERIVWDGRSNKGESVQAATDYPFTFKAADSLGNASSMDGIVGVDVLVIRDGDRLKIQVPSIIFRGGFADFKDLPTETVDNNIRVLRRIAEILNTFRDYRVQVEGHANRTQTAEAAAATEERTELQPLSESRAKAVVDLLVEYGVARSRLSAIGMGGTKPVVRYTDTNNTWKNRRVEFILIK
jgi:flagellar hook assembly protein FlgD/flagellar motor protein MotB